MKQISYLRHRFPGSIIQHAVWLYFRFPLSFRNVEDMLAERGIDVSYESVRRWSVKFGLGYARTLRRLRPRPDGRGHLDEMFVSIDGKRMYPWRAVDSEGEVLDILVQSRRNKKAALKLMRKLLKKQGFVPDAFVTDKLPSYGCRFGWSRLVEAARFWRQEEQSSRELTSAGSATRAKDAALQVGWISATISVHPCRPLQQLQRSTPSDLPKDTSRISNCRHGRMACSGCRLNAANTASLRL